MKPDPRRDPTSRPPGRTTGERIISARETLDSIAPLPSLPPESERVSKPDWFLEHIQKLHESDRTVAAAIFGDLQEHGRQIEALKGEVDGLKMSLGEVETRLSKRLDRLEEGYKAIASDQIYVRQETAKTNSKLDRFQQTAEEVNSRFDTRLKAIEQQRVPKLEGRVDGVETRQQKQLDDQHKQFEEVLRRLSSLEAAVDALKAGINGGPPITPRAPTNYPGDPEGTK